MANYSTLTDMLNTTAGMTVIRNNNANDDSVDSVNGVNWFKFNNVVANTIYVSGNHFIGFGNNSPQLKVCNRDGKCYYVYREEGVINSKYNFLKIRWEGYTRYNYTSEEYALKFEVFLLSTGNIFLNIIKAPTNSSYMGTSALVCGSSTYPFAVAYNSQMPLYYSFYTQDVTGSTWDIINELMDLGTKTYASSGSSVFSFDDINAITDYYSSKIIWMGDEPEGTSLKIYAAIKATIPLDADYIECSNISEIPGIGLHENISTKKLYIKVVLETTDTTKSPSLLSLSFEIIDDKYNTYVPVVEPGKYKISCDISNKIHGITVLNKKTSLLNFANGEQLPVFSVHMFVEGVVSYISAGYIYENIPMPPIEFDTTEASSIYEYAPQLDEILYSENCPFVTGIESLICIESSSIVLI